jgi:porin
MNPRFRRTIIAGLALVCLSAIPGRAQQVDAPDMDDTATNIFQQETLIGHAIPYRKTLEDEGVSLGADEIFDALGNPQGGDKQGATFEGRFELFANVDLEKALGLSGLLFHVNAYQIHGQGLSAGDIGNLLTVSNIGARSSTRLFGLWLQKSLYNDTLSIRAGQLAADDEFFISQYASLFINSAFGWPSILGINLPSGGPAYPLATPGVRVRLAISPALVATTAIFNGDAAPAGAGDAQQRDASGTSFRVNGNLFWISELAYTANLPIGSGDLPGTFKLGGWYHDGVFLDQQYDVLGRSLADPASSGIAAPRRGNFGAYFIADQQLWLKEGSKGQGLAAFFRIGGDP